MPATVSLISCENSRPDITFSPRISSLYAFRVSSVIIWSHIFYHPSVQLLLEILFPLDFCASVDPSVQLLPVELHPAPSVQFRPVSSFRPAPSVQLLASSTFCSDPSVQLLTFSFLCSAPSVQLRIFTRALMARDVYDRPIDLINTPMNKSRKFLKQCYAFLITICLHNRGDGRPPSMTIQPSISSDKPPCLQTRTR